MTQLRVGDVEHFDAFVVGGIAKKHTGESDAGVGQRGQVLEHVILGDCGELLDVKAHHSRRR